MWTSQGNVYEDVDHVIPRVTNFMWLIPLKSRLNPNHVKSRFPYLLGCEIWVEPGRISDLLTLPSHKSHNAWDKYHTMYNFVTEMCTRAHFWYKMVRCGMWDWRIVGFVW